MNVEELIKCGQRCNWRRGLTKFGWLYGCLNRVSMEMHCNSRSQQVEDMLWGL